MAKKDKNSRGQEEESLGSGVSKKFKQNPALYIGSVVILVLVVFIFLFAELLGGGAGRDSGDWTFGYYDKTPISWVHGNTFTQYHRNISNYYQSQGVDPNDSRFSSQIFRQAFERTVLDTAILKTMKSSNYIVPDKTVDRNVAQLPQFQENGRFSRALYNQMSESNRRILWRQIQEDLIKKMYYDNIFGLLIPASEAEFIAKMVSPVRSFDMVSFSVDNYPYSEYLDFAEENTELFRSIHLSKITINSEREAKRLLELLKDGSLLFEDVAISQSMDFYAERGGDMGSRFFYELDQEIPSVFDRDTIVNMEKGQLSEVINMGDNWSIFRVEEELTEPDFTNDAIMDTVRSYVRNFQRGRMEDWAIAQANEFIEAANESSFDSVANLWSLNKQSFGPLPINFGSLDLFSSQEKYSLESFSLPGIDLHNMARNENFWKIAFSTEINTLSEPFVQGNNVIVFLPTQQEEADVEIIDSITLMYLSYYLNNITDQLLLQYFLNHEKMEDNFWDVYFRIFMN